MRKRTLMQTMATTPVPISMDPTKKAPRKNVCHAMKLVLYSFMVLTPAILVAYNATGPISALVSPYTDDNLPKQALPQQSQPFLSYEPAPIERFMLENATLLGYDKPRSEGCRIYNDPSLAGAALHGALRAFTADLDEYDLKVKELFSALPILDHRRQGGNSRCESVRLHPDGLPGIFKSGQLSRSTSGYIEPLITPMRHPAACLSQKKLSINHLPFNRMNDLRYLVHDFEHMCHAMKPTSRSVLVDMGASFDRGSKMLYLIELYEKFGFPFDHIYAYEMTNIPASKVYKEQLPESLFSSFHWINVGVSSDPSSRLNPLKMLLEKYDEDDLIIVKLDIDAPDIEVPLAKQLLKDDRFVDLVDQFYFEHHVSMKEMDIFWEIGNLPETVKDTLQMFCDLRTKGIPAHFWI